MLLIDLVQFNIMCLFHCQVLQSLTMTEIYLAKCVLRLKLIEQFFWYVQLTFTLIKQPELLIHIIPNPCRYAIRKCRLSELSLSLKLSHHQFITSVDVAEVITIALLSSRQKHFYIFCQKPIFLEKGLISETDSIRYLTDLSKLQMGVSILHSNVCLSGIRILPQTILSQRFSQASTSLHKYTYVDQNL